MRRIHLVLAAVLAASPAFGQEALEYGASMRLSGAAYSGVEGTPGLPDSALVDSRFRPWLKASKDPVSLGFEIELKASHVSSGGESLVGSQSGGSPLGQAGAFERWDWTWDHTDKPRSKVRTRVERLDLTAVTGPIDWDIGRQPISMGTSHFVGVLDVIAPFAPGDLDSTYKPGVDAARARTAVGESGEAEVIAAAAREWGAGALLGRMRAMVRGVDLEVVSGRFRRRAFGGAGWEGELGRFNLWGELALFERRPRFETFRGGWTEAAFSGVTGVEVSPWSETTLGASFLWQDFGARSRLELNAVPFDAPYREGWVFLGACAYVSVTAHRKVHPLVDLDLSGIISVVDSSTLWQPKATVSVSDESDLVLYGWVGTGAGPSDLGLLESEFGAVPDGGGAYFRWYF